MLEVDEDVLYTLLDGPSLLLQVQSGADPEQLRQVLAAVAGDISALGTEQGGPAFVSTPVPTPQGPLLQLDLGEDLPDDDLRRIPELVVTRLAQAGVQDAYVRVPPDGPALEHVREWTAAARCWLRGRDDLTPLLDLAHAWLREHAKSAWFQHTSGALFPLTADQARPATEALLRAGWEATILASDFTTSAHAISLYRSPLSAPRAALATTGTSTVADLHDSRALIRAHAGELSWAGVDVEPDARDLTCSRWYSRTRDHLLDPDSVSDLLVPDGMWFQLLTTGHLDRLGGLPPGAVELAPGVAELTVGEPEQWLPGHPDQDAVRRQARELLSACLATPDRVHELGQKSLTERRGGPCRTGISSCS